VMCSAANDNRTAWSWLHLVQFDIFVMLLVTISKEDLQVATETRHLADFFFWVQSAWSL